MRFRLLPYKQGSKSAASLAEALGGKVLKLQESRYKPRTDDVVINWGNGTGVPLDWPVRTFNGHGLATVANKLAFFNVVSASCPDILPPFWTNKDDIPDDAFPVVCRTILSGHSGAGIVIASTRSDLVDCSLYVKYIKKKDEYRVHYGLREPGVAAVISVQRKARRLECGEPNWQVRNHQNGFVYVREGVSPPPAVTEAARLSFLASGLDFGAVDVIWNDKKSKAYVLEINTAPGLEGQTVEDYATFFKETCCD